MRDGMIQSDRRITSVSARAWPKILSSSPRSRSRRWGRPRGHGQSCSARIVTDARRLPARVSRSCSTTCVPILPVRCPPLAGGHLVSPRIDSCAGHYRECRPLRGDLRKPCHVIGGPAAVRELGPPYALAHRYALCTLRRIATPTKARQRSSAELGSGTAAITAVRGPSS